MIWSIPNFFDKIICNCIIGIISEVWMPLMQFSHMCACAGFVCFSPLCMIDKTSLLGIKETKLLLNSRLYIFSLKHIYIELENWPQKFSTHSLSQNSFMVQNYHFLELAPTTELSRIRDVIYLTVEYGWHYYLRILIMDFRCSLCD